MGSSYRMWPRFTRVRDTGAGSERTAQASQQDGRAEQPGGRLHCMGVNGSSVEVQNRWR